MKDTQALDTALEDAIKETEAEPEETVTESEPVEQPEKVKPEEVKDVEVQEPEEGEQQQEESFTKLDPNSLPEEVKPFYKSMLADYTRKRQAESAEVKGLRTEVETLKSTLENLQQQDYEPEQQGDPNRPLIAEEVREIVIREREQAWETEAQVDFPNLDPRLDENNPIEYDKSLDFVVRAMLDSELADHIEKTGTKLGFDYKGAVKGILEAENKRLENLFKSWTQKQTQKVKENAEKLKKASPNSVSAPSNKISKGMSLDEALDAALEVTSN